MVRCRVLGFSQQQSETTPTLEAKVYVRKRPLNEIEIKYNERDIAVIHKIDKPM